MRNKIENIRYSLLLGCYMMIMCAGFNYVTYYLLEKGISNKMVGVLIAGSCLLAVVLQQVLGRLVDKGKLEGKKALLLLALLQSVLGFCLVAFKATWAIFLMFGVILCSIQIMQPILNSFSFYYKNEGIGVNYGVARGVGSLCYSGASVILGTLTVKMGNVSVPLCLGVLNAIIFVILLTMPSFKSPVETDTNKKAPGSFRLFHYPFFAIMLLGLSLVMLFHNMVMTYFIHVVNRAGGNTANMGLAIAIAGIVEIPVLFFYTKLKGNRPSRYFLALSGVAFFVKAVLFCLARNMGMIYFTQSLQFMAFGLMAASRVYYVDETVGKENETTGQAYIAATETVGMVLGSALGGLLIQSQDVTNLLYVGAIVCFVGMVLMLFSALRDGRGQKALS